MVWLFFWCNNYKKNPVDERELNVYWKVNNNQEKKKITNSQFTIAWCIFQFFLNLSRLYHGNSYSERNILITLWYFYINYSQLDRYSIAMIQTTELSLCMTLVSMSIFVTVYDRVVIKNLLCLLNSLVDTHSKSKLVLFELFFDFHEIERAWSKIIELTLTFEKFTLKYIKLSVSEKMKLSRNGNLSPDNHLNSTGKLHYSKKLWHFSVEKKIVSMWYEWTNRNWF